MRKKISAGNWKMNGTRASLNQIFEMASVASEASETIICTPFTLLSEALAGVQGTHLLIGAENCHQESAGAYTGEISAAMIADIGASHVIVGHSERREYFGESDELVANKAEAVYEAGMVAIICVGETLAEREAGQALEVVKNQLIGSIPKRATGANTVIAYEPVWAIGTGKTASNDDIAQMHAHIRAHIPDAENMRVLYGGSVKPDNAKEIFNIDNVDGGLVGGASLKSTDFIPIIEAAGS